MLKDLLRYRVNAVYVGGVLMAAFLIFLAVAFMINRTFTLNFWDPGYQLKADFVDADGIANASDIRINGVYVGQVTEIRSINGGLAEITFQGTKVVQIAIHPMIILDQAQPNFLNPATDMDAKALSKAIKAVADPLGW